MISCSTKYSKSYFFHGKQRLKEVKYTLERELTTMSNRREHQGFNTPTNETFLADERELLSPEHQVFVKKPDENDAEIIADLYKQAYLRSDFFAGRYDDPKAQIFNPRWLAIDFKNPDHKWFEFLNNKEDIIGTTGFFHDYDVGGESVFVSDETQIAPEGRGMRIMDNFFHLVVPRIEDRGNQVATEFVLTPESKGLRRTLQTDLGMTATGILPHILKHKLHYITKSEIPAVKFSNYKQQQVSILPVFEPLYEIVQSQINSLPEPEILPRGSHNISHFATTYQESDQLADGSNPDQQRELLLKGFMPVEYLPHRNSFRMARVPRPAPELGFIIDNELIFVNRALVSYMKEVLYEDE